MSALFLLLIACESPAPPPPAAEPPTPASSSATPAAQAQDEARALAQAHEAASLLGSTLKSRMGQAMGQGGPDAAVAVCADEAQGLAAQVRGSTGARVGRASLKLRNPANAGPDWVQAWLREQGERPAEGAPARSEIADTEAGRVARVIRPIAVEPLCLSCHGDPAATRRRSLKACRPCSRSAILRIRPPATWRAPCAAPCGRRWP